MVAVNLAIVSKKMTIKSKNKKLKNNNRQLKRSFTTQNTDKKFNPTFAGKYQDLQEIGQGGQAIIYRARDQKGRIVAIKVLTIEDDGWKAQVDWDAEVYALKKL